MVNTVLLFATCMYSVYSGMGTRCKDQSNGTQTKDQSYGPMGTQCMYKSAVLGTRGNCVYEGPTLQGLDAQREVQSYEHTMHVQSSNPMGRCM